MTPSVGPHFPFSEHTCLGADGVTLAIESCRVTVFIVIESGVHHSP